MVLRRAGISRRGIERLRQPPRSLQLSLFPSSLSSSSYGRCGSIRLPATPQVASLTTTATADPFGVVGARSFSHSFSSWQQQQQRQQQQQQRLWTMAANPETPTLATETGTPTTVAAATTTETTTNDYAETFAKLVHRGEMEQAWAFFQELHGLFQSTGNVKYCPGVTCANLLLEGWLQLQPPGKLKENASSSSSSPPSSSSSSPQQQQQQQPLNNDNDNKNSNVPQMAMTLLEQMNQMALQSETTNTTAGIVNNMARPNHETYELILKIWSKHYPKQPQKVQALLHSFEQQQQQQATSSSSLLQLPNFPSLAMYQIVMENWALSDISQGQSARGAMAFLKHMYRYSNDQPQKQQPSQQQQVQGGQGRPWMKPNTDIYTSVIQAWSRSFHWDGPLHSQQLLNDMEVHHDLVPTMEAYRWALLACNRSLRKNAPDMAQLIFDRAWRRYENSKDPQWRPTVIMCNILMHVWARAGNAIQCETILRNHYHPTLAPPNIITYSTILHALVRSKQRDTAERGMQIFQTILQEYWNGNTDMCPSAKTYSMLISVWGRSGRPDAIEQAQAIFDALAEKKYPIQANLSAKLPWMEGREGNENDENVDGRPVVVRERFPNLFHANAMLNAFAQRGEGQQAEDFLLHRMPLEQIKPCIISFNTVIHAWNKSKDPKNVERAQAVFDLLASHGITPNAQTFGSLITGWARSDRPDSGEQAQALFDQLLELHAKDPLNSDLRPLVPECSALLDAWARQKGGAARGEYELRRMIQPFLDAVDKDNKNNSSNKTTTEKAEHEMFDIETPNPAGKPTSVMGKPNSHCFNIVIAGYARHAKWFSPDDGAPEKGEELLQWMTELHTSPVNLPCQPSEWTFTTAIQVWSEVAGRYGRSHDAWAGATRLYREMIHRYETGQACCKPGTHVFAALFRVALKCRHFDNRDRQEWAHRILQEMDHYGVKADRRIHIYVQLCEGDYTNSRHQYHPDMMASFQDDFSNDWMNEPAEPYRPPHPT